MIKSKYLTDILDLTFDGFEYEDLLRHQITHLVEKDREHTGFGLFIHFIADNEIDKFKIPTDKVTNYDINGNPYEMLIGIEIKNEELSILADATVYITNGIIDSIEIWNKNGEDYPMRDPEKYVLSQLWTDAPKRQIIQK